MQTLHRSLSGKSDQGRRRRQGIHQRAERLLGLHLLRQRMQGRSHRLLLRGRHRRQRQHPGDYRLWTVTAPDGNKTVVRINKKDANKY